MLHLPDRHLDGIKYSLAAVTILLLAITAFKYARLQHVFLIRTIEISGRNEVNEGDLMSRSKIRCGMNIFHTDIAGTIHLLRDHPYIWDAHVNTVLPDKVEIEIFEREPEALLKLENIYALDKFATLLPPPAHSPDLPAITGITAVHRLHVAEKVKHPLIREALHMITLTHKSFPLIRKNLSELHWDEKNTSWIAIFNGRPQPRIYLGNEDLNDRLLILERYLDKARVEHRDLRHLEYIDLRYKDQILEK